MAASAVSLSGVEAAYALVSCFFRPGRGKQVRLLIAILQPEQLLFDMDTARIAGQLTLTTGHPVAGYHDRDSIRPVGRCCGTYAFFVPGTPDRPGVYINWMKFKLPDGREEVMKGDVTVIK